MTQHKKSSEKPLVPLRSICQVLRITARRAEQLVADGILPRPEGLGRGAKYDLINSIWAYFSWREVKSVEKSMKGASRHRAEEEYRTVKAARERLKLEQEQGILMKKTDVGNLCKYLLTVVKTMLLAQSRSLPPLLVSKTEAEISDIIENENRKILEAAATGFGEVVAKSTRNERGK